MSETSRVVMLELVNVSLSYHAAKATFDHGVHHVLDDVSLRLYEGETLGIIGRNGVGKTTMLRLMAGILAPTSGSVSRHPGKTSSLLSIGLGFRPDLSGRDNALLSAVLQGATLKQAKSYLEEIRDFTELGDSFELPVKTYSSGMRARLGFTTALMTHVDILLVDEVLSVGDAEFKAKARHAMKERVRVHQTVVFVSHSSGQIKELCDRAIWLDRGRIMREGDTAAVLREYLAQVSPDSTAKVGRKRSRKQAFTDQQLDSLKVELGLRDAQLLEMLEMRDQGSGRRAIVRAVLDDQQMEKFKQAKRARRRRQKQERQVPGEG